VNDENNKTILNLSPVKPNENFKEGLTMSENVVECENILK
jgi:hypothetical protein